MAKTKEELNAAVQARRAIKARMRRARQTALKRRVSVLAPPVTEARFCANCLREDVELTPWRPPFHPANCATPKFCDEHLPKPGEKRGPAPDAQKWAEFQNDYNEAKALLRGQEAARRLLRTEPLPEQYRLPTFVWDIPEPRQNLYTEVKRGFVYVKTNW